MLWCLGDEQADDEGVISGYTKEDVDNYIGIENFCESLPSSWIDFNGEDVKLPNYQSHNGVTGKKRAQDQKRQKNSRKQFDTPVESERDKKATREEKRREENINKIFKTSCPNSDSETAKWMTEKIEKLKGEQNLNEKQQKLRFEKLRKQIINWSNEIRRMREIDGVTDEEIRSLFDLANKDFFWKKNILSPHKLRKHWDELIIKLKRGNGHEEPGNSGNSAIDRFESAIKNRDDKINQDLIRESSDEGNLIER